MISPMTKYSFILLNGEQEGLLEKLQEIGLVDVTRSVKPVDGQSAALLAEAERRRNLIQALDKMEFPEGLTPASVGGDLADAADAALKHLEDLGEQMKAAEKEAATNEPWGAFSPEMLKILSEAGYPIQFHITSTKAFKPEWTEECAVQIVNEKDGKTYFVVAGPDTLPDRVRGPKQSAESIKEQIRGLQAEMDREKAVLLGAKARQEEFEAESRENLSKLDLYLASQAAVPAAENTIVTLVGYAPTENEESVTASLEETGVFYLKEDAKTEDNPPIRFRNNKFVKMFEVLTDMYGRPAYDGFDPTPFISIFFLLFFALCMGDAGYGLVLILVGLLLRKVDSFKDMAPLVVTLGAGTVVVGFFLHTFFSIDIAQWKVFEPIKGIFLPDEIGGYAGGMVLAIIIGILHLCLAMIVKAIQEVKVKGFAGSLGTLGWTLLIVGGVIVGAFALTGVLDAKLTKWIIIVIGVVSALGIFPFNNPDRNKLANVGLGLWDTYNTATGLLGDVLSYLRLYALGLAGSMLGMAFNDMGKMVLGDGHSWVLWIPFILLVLVGHTLNIAMCALGAFVHPLRLNFLEFFKNSGYEATGRNYNPLKKQTNK